MIRNSFSTGLMVLASAVVLIATGCETGDTDGDPGTDAGDGQTTARAWMGPPPRSPSIAVVPVSAREAVELPEGVSHRPLWLATRELPRRHDGIGVAQPTPPELRDRRMPPPYDHPLPPPEDDRYESAITEVPDEVVERSTWSADCPITLDELRYLTMTFWGFDEQPHTGEMIVHRDVAEDVVGAFHRTYEARFPIEEMRVVAEDELDLPPTGDGNNTTGFVCRARVESGTWSEHAYGLAIDVNPFHNPYVRGDVVIPELAMAYADRSWDRPGMLAHGDVVVTAFADIGWLWGGHWTSASDPMHFSPSGH